MKIDSKTLKLTEELPVIDGAAAFFPVYSAFVNAVYPETTELYDGTFEYNNTPEGYRNLAEKNIDLFLGVYPSEEQKAYEENSNENVDKLLQWILSEEGQYIIEETGYVGVSD